MRFTAQQLDRWATWIETETSYSITKFPAETQIGYFSAGVARGEFSWKSSCINYLLRSVMRTVEGQPISGMELQVVQGLAKSAHNHLTCAAVGRMVFSGDRKLLGHVSDVIADWRSPLADGVVEGSDLSRQMVELQKQGFNSLQHVQDTDPQLFDTTIAVFGLPIQATFIAAAEKYGWPKPGNSTHGAQPWDLNRELT